MFDNILIILIILSLSFIIWIIAKKLPRLINVNVDSLPEIRAKRQKEAILKSRLQRSWLESWYRLKDLSQPFKNKIGNIFKQYYKKLKEAEKDIRRRGFEKLTSSVDRSQVIDELLIKTKQFINNEEYKQAEDILLDAINMDQYNVEVYKLLAEVYRCRKEYSQAKETLQYILKLTHGEEEDIIYSSLANIAKERGNLKQAEEDYLKSISLSKDNYLYFLSLAEVYLDLEEEEKALETAQRALILSSNNPKILDFLINISILMSDKELALEYLDKLKKVNPDNQKIVEFIERIDSLE